MAIAKYIVRATASEIEDINGLAINAGSRLILFTIRGTIDPRTLAKITINTIALQMVRAIITLSPSRNTTLRKLKQLRITPTRAPTLTSFQSGLALSDLAYDQELRFNEIVAYEKLGDPLKAKELMTSYIQDYPNDEVAQREYQFLKTR